MPPVQFWIVIVVIIAGFAKKPVLSLISGRVRIGLRHHDIVEDAARCVDLVVMRVLPRVRQSRCSCLEKLLWGVQLDKMPPPMRGNRNEGDQKLYGFIQSTLELSALPVTR